MKHEELTAEIIQIFYKVYNSLGYGFLERVYENALSIEFRKAGLNFKNQVPIKVFYKDEIVGEYVTDFVIDEKVVVEIKATLGLGVPDESQLLNYLRCTRKEVGLLLNFGKKAEVKRKVFSNVNEKQE
ncbi:GxxExxY protein [Candidatus Pacearchaeota archaeon]|nr:GxxExxY protein [Candidatus Pacearchaeota archaeon]